MDICAWFRLEIDGVLWDIAPTYVAPVSLAAARTHARAAGCELPTRKMVDAIWAAATCRVEPLPRKHDGTTQTMATPLVYSDQARRIAAQLAAPGLDLRLVAGTHKDVICTDWGALDVYGWHRPNGVRLQPGATNHGKYLGYIDYSQGLRLCRRV
jgi:hypothetical protein